MPSFRPGGMSDSEQSDSDFDDFYVHNPQPRSVATTVATAPQRTDDAGTTSTPPVEILSNAEIKHRRLEYIYNNALKEITSDLDTFDCVEQALTEGIGINEVKGSGWTFLNYACKEAKPKTISYLLDKGANVNHTAQGDTQADGFSPVLSLCYSTKAAKNTSLFKECLELLISKGAVLSSPSSQDSLPLLYAAKENLVEIVEVLLQFGIDINERDAEGNTALHLAAERGHGRVIRVLLQQGADTEIQNEDGRTAYDNSIEHDFYQIADILHRVQATMWVPGSDPALLKQLRSPDPEKMVSPKEQLLRPQKEIIDMTLESLGFAKLIPTFKEHNMDFLAFLRLTDEDLQSIGINEFGTRRKILDAVRTLHNAEWNKSSLNSFYLQGNITSPEVVCMLDDMKKHLDFMTQTMTFIHKRILAEPKTLVTGADRARPPELARYTDAAILASDVLKVKAQELAQFFRDQVEDRADLKIGDNIKKKPNEKIKRYISAAFFLSAVFFLTIKFRFLNR